MNSPAATAGRARGSHRRTPKTASRIGPWENLGQLLFTLGVVVMLLACYELWFSNVISGFYQGQATDQLDRQWQAQPPVRAGSALAPLPPPADGQGFAKLYLPTIKEQFTVVQGTTQPDLGKGPGHYVGTAMPGERGNLAIAGHRVGHGAPFTDIDTLASCAPLVVETGNAWFVYRVLPLTGEAADWTTGAGRRPQCAGVVPLPGSYQGVPGQQIVSPDRRDMVVPVPGRTGPPPPDGQRMALITLTTCNPKFSARERLIVHGMLTRVYAKSAARPDFRPTEINET